MDPVHICTPVVGDTMEEFLTNLEKVQHISNLVELRADYIRQLGPEDVVTLRKATRKKVLFTCRSQKEGGRFTQSMKRLVEVIQQAFTLGFDYVDIEAPLLRKHTFANPSQSRIIACYHNFDKTPSEKYLITLIDRMESYHPTIVKIATMVNSEQDTQTLFRLMVRKRKLSQQHIIIGMGLMGRSTRLLGPIVGQCPIVFAATEYCQSAPGQITIDEMTAFFDSIGVKYTK